MADAKVGKQTVKEITDRLEEGLQELFESEKYKNYLNTMSKFHNYSVNNSMLIAMQMPEATLVAGYRSWQKNFGRHVNKGEKAIRILAPAPYKIKEERDKKDPVTGSTVVDKDGVPEKEEVEVTIPAFQVVSVFDVSQTDGKPLPELGVEELLATVEGYEDFKQAVINVSPVPVDFEYIQGEAKGYFSLVGKRIVVQENMGESQTLKTMIHEVAHSMLHDIDENRKAEPELPEKDRNTKEVEAESIAYTVCQHFGIETSDYSFGYIAGWSSGKDARELRSSLDTIRKTASELITGIEAQLRELKLSRELMQAQTKEELPDPMIGLSEMWEYGYTWSEMLPLTKEKALELFDNDLPVFLLHNDGSETTVEDKEQITGHEGIFGIEKADWENERSFRAMHQELEESAANKTVQLLYGNADRFGIYQLKETPELNRFQFEGTETLKKLGKYDDVIKPENYTLIYVGELAELQGQTQSGTLKAIHERFNIDRPEDFKGHSLSVSDMVVLHENGKNSAHYVDSYGFTELPDFMLDLAGEKVQQGQLGRYPSLYHSTLSYAVEHREEGEYRKSQKLNVECRKAIEDVIGEKLDVQSLNPDMVKPLLEQYGSERMSYILAHSMARHPLWEENLSSDNKAWIDALSIPLSIVEGMEIEVRCDASVLNGFIDIFRREVKAQEIEKAIDQESELAFSIADRFISIQEVDGGYDYSIMGVDYREIDGGVYDNPDVTIREALKDIVDDLRSEPDNNGAKGNIGEDDELIPIDYDDLMEKVENANRIEPQNNVEAGYDVKTDELNKSGQKKDRQKSVTDGQEQPAKRTSLKARLAEKSVEVAGQEHNAKVKSNHKNNQREI